MDQDKYTTYRASLIEEAFSISDKKGEDYRIGSSDVHYNFKHIASRLGQDPIDIIMVYMLKHQDAIANYAKSGGQSESEPIRQRIIDNINYLVLLGALIEEDTHDLSDYEHWQDSRDTGACCQNGNHKN